MRAGQEVRDMITKRYGRLRRVIPRYEADELLWVVKLEGEFPEARGGELANPMPYKVVHRLELDLESV